jgi:hypothetical protein
MKKLSAISWPVVIILCLTLGLAPYTPEPHVWQKLQMLLSGTLTRPIDILDFILHGAPWVLLVLKVVRG